MARTLRFHLDEHVHSAIAKGLRRRAIDVTTTVEADLRQGPDRDHLAFARSEGRVLVTHDPDFVILSAQDPSHAGIAFCDQGRRSVGEIIRALVILWEGHVPEGMRGRVVYL